MQYKWMHVLNRTGLAKIVGQFQFYSNASKPCSYHKMLFLKGTEIVEFDDEGGKWAMKLSLRTNSVDYLLYKLLNCFE